MRAVWFWAGALTVPALVLGCGAALAQASNAELRPSVATPALVVIRAGGATIDTIDPLGRLSKPKPLTLATSDMPDSTGSIAPAPAPAGEALPQAETPRAEPQDAASHPALDVAPPELPASPVISTASPTVPPSNPPSSEFTEALARFTADGARRPRESIAANLQRMKDREAIAAFYAARANAPLWLDGSQFSAKARAALARIDRAGEDGLNLAPFAVPALHAPEPRDLANADLAVTEAVVTYAKQARGARIDPLQISRLITAKPTIPEVADILTTVSGASDPDATLRGYNPPQAGYAQLRDKLAELRQQDVPVAHEAIPSGPTLRPGMRDARVPLIRSRFGLDLPSAAAADGLVYDTKVAAAVADFQRSVGMNASGILTPKTIAALSGGNPPQLESEIVANMERWRWLPRDLGVDHITVNVPDYALDVVRDGSVVHHARVVVGKPDHQTPIFSDVMRFIIVNPYWNVPLSIIKKEMMPKLAENPNYFADHGYEVVERDGVTYVRQPPGDDNALGRIKFMFPNQHSVYLHDTNARALFGNDKRAFSHGCVRVDQPFKLAEVVLGKDAGWSEARVKKMVGGTERTIMLPTPLPIHITYFTAYVDDHGALNLRDDIYGYSARVKSALALAE